MTSATGCPASSLPHRQLRNGTEVARSRGIAFTAAQAAQKVQGMEWRDYALFTAAQAAQKRTSRNQGWSKTFTAAQAAQKMTGVVA